MLLSNGCISKTASITVLIKENAVTTASPDALRKTAVLPVKYIERTRVLSGGGEVLEYLVNEGVRACVAKQVIGKADYLSDLSAFINIFDGKLEDWWAGGNPEKQRVWSLMLEDGKSGKSICAEISVDTIEAYTARAE